MATTSMGTSAVEWQVSQETKGTPKERRSVHRRVRWHQSQAWFFVIAAFLQAVEGTQCLRGGSQRDSFHAGRSAEAEWGNQSSIDCKIPRGSGEIATPPRSERLESETQGTEKDRRPEEANCGQRELLCGVEKEYESNHTTRRRSIHERDTTAQRAARESSQRRGGRGVHGLRWEHTVGKGEIEIRKDCHGKATCRSRHPLSEDASRQPRDAPEDGLDPLRTTSIYGLRSEQNHYDGSGYAFTTYGEITNQCECHAHRNQAFQANTRPRWTIHTSYSHPDHARGQRESAGPGDSRFEYDPRPGLGEPRSSNRSRGPGVRTLGRMGHAKNETQLLYGEDPVSWKQFPSFEYQGIDHGHDQQSQRMMVSFAFLTGMPKLEKWLTLLCICLCNGIGCLALNDTHFHSWAISFLHEQQLEFCLDERLRLFLISQFVVIIVPMILFGYGKLIEAAFFNVERHRELVKVRGIRLSRPVVRRERRTALRECRQRRSFLFALYCYHRPLLNARKFLTGQMLILSRSMQNNLPRNRIWLPGPSKCRRRFIGRGKQ